MDQESIFKSLTVKGDGILLSLDELSKAGKKFLYCCLHLLTNPLELEPLNQKSTFNTFQFLSQNKNICVSKMKF